MTIHIDQNFSVYQYVLHSASRNIFSDNFHMLRHWCSSIENEIIKQSIPLTLFAGFQELQYFSPMVERYKTIGKVANHVYIFGEGSHQIEPIPNITYVPLACHDQLRYEWFVIAHHENYSRALIALETTPPHTVKHERRFKGVLTSDIKIIEPIYQSLMGQIAPQV